MFLLCWIVIKIVVGNPGSYKFYVKLVTFGKYRIILYNCINF